LKTSENDLFEETIRNQKWGVAGELPNKVRYFQRQGANVIKQYRGKLPW